MKISSNQLLKLMFIIGAIIDGAVAISWFLIASGLRIPNILNGHVGTGLDYQLAMFVAAMFMAGWTALLAWGAVKPIDRRGLLLITSVSLFLSVIVELVFFRDVLGGAGFLFGMTKRTLLSLLFAASYFYSLKEIESIDST
ncbi:MAG: hypothetical protein C0629_02590 [Chromatiales bacterium]|jgi:hypothetical protein|nr:MAG: hypothetical protein C0629_02590 [Chromatiales bacterium]